MDNTSIYSALTLFIATAFLVRIVYEDMVRMFADDPEI